MTKIDNNIGYNQLLRRRKNGIWIQRTFDGRQTKRRKQLQRFGRRTYCLQRHTRRFGRNKNFQTGGLVSSLLGSAVSAGVGVASAAIVNKMHENSQLKLQEQQAQQQAEYARQQAEQQAELARQQAEVQLEIERLKAKQEETKRDAIQDLRYYANCPYCLGVNNGAKFCQYCGSSLAYYDEDDDMNNDKKTEGGNAKAQ